MTAGNLRQLILVGAMGLAFAAADIPRTAAQSAAPGGMSMPAQGGDQAAAKALSLASARCSAGRAPRRSSYAVNAGFASSILKRSM